MMATTYGYAGEFSSDEDVDKIEQQQTDRMVQAKYDNNLRPSKKQIEDAIEAIKLLPIDQEVSLSDEMLAGLLDYFKTQRGPIVDSTRKLYIKIALRLIRGDQQSKLVDASDNAPPKNTNGNSNNNNLNDNNNSINNINKVPQQKSDSFSSDEDDDLPAFNRLTEQKGSDESKMDIDSVTPTGPVRVTKQVDMSTTDEEDEESGSNDDTSELEELNSESDVMDVTPIKPPANHQQSVVSKEREAVEAVIAASRIAPKQPESSIKRQPLAQSTPKDPTDTAKKPYTRSQRVATRSATRGRASTEPPAKKVTEPGASAHAFIENRRTTSKKYIVLAVTILILASAFLLYYFRSNMTSSAARFLGPKVKF